MKVSSKLTAYMRDAVPRLQADLEACQSAMPLDSSVCNKVVNIQMIRILAPGCLVLNLAQQIHVLISITGRRLDLALYMHTDLWCKDHVRSFVVLAFLKGCQRSNSHDCLAKAHLISQNPWTTS